MLTRKQRELLKFIQEKLGETGISPSFDEMKEALGLKSKSGVHRLITGLEERGFIKRLPHRARALDVVRLPEDQTAKAAQAPAARARSGAPASTSSAATSRRPCPAPWWRPSPAARCSFRSMARSRPAPRSRPCATIRTPSTCPANLVGRGEHYALTVEGDSMVDAGIHDGDMVVIERCETAENGTIVVALIDNSEVTLKRLRRKGDSIALEPANPAHKTRIFGPDRVRIQGRLVGLMRRY